MYEILFIEIMKQYVKKYESIKDNKSLQYAIIEFFFINKTLVNIFKYKGEIKDVMDVFGKIEETKFEIYRKEYEGFSKFYEK